MEKEETHKSKIAEREEEILKFWKENRIFEKSLEKESPKGEFVFYDGPPFATGLPHYGHIVASVIKDVIPRYKTMCGYRVPRVWGWDCHGLPIENIVEKELGFKNKKDIKEFGIEKFNKLCRERVLTYAHEWEKAIPRIGRWVDMENSYKTMDKTYMESVWWVFKQLYDKGLIYEDYRSMHICPRCETTLSQQEVAEGYKDVKDIAVTVKFHLKPGQKFANGKYETKDTAYILAWTTTPWTLPGNVALAVGENIKYTALRISGVMELYIVGSTVVEKIFKDKEIEIVHNDLTGKDLVGLEYEPLFDYYYKDETLKNRENGWKVYAADFVTEDSGTGIAHEAPAFGADDWDLLKKYNLPFVQHVNMDGTMKPEVKDFAGMEVKPKSDDDKVRLGTDIAVIRYLQEHKLFFSKENIMHAYPHCWRCDTPLLNYATSSWFVSVTKIKDKLLKNSEDVNWSPAHIKEGRFGKWLEGARDWSVSRQRFWASVLPIWRDDEGNLEVIGSVDELKEKTVKSGNKYFEIRHGESESNVRQIASQDNSVMSHLTKNGREQIRKNLKKLKSEKIDLVFVSPLLRAQESAEIITSELGIPRENIFTDDRLKEIQTGVYNGKTLSEYHDFASVEDRLTTAPQSGESLMDVTRRMGDFIYTIDTKYKNKNILIVSHGDPLSMLKFIVSGGTKRDLREAEEDYPDLGELNEFEFVPLPHNENYELDLHRPYIDEVKLANKKGKELMRVPDVLDTWFDSGSMPYGQVYYPFENKEKFEQTFPAEFIGEGVDQTRAWFYYLHVLAGALFNKHAFKNVIVNGIVLAEDGQKMSKKLKNYPDPMNMVGRYGADALRYYLMSSPVVRAEDLAFSEKGLDEVHKKIILRLQNVLSFYEMYPADSSEKDYSKSDILDVWIASRLARLRNEVTEGLDSYELDKAARPIMDFVDDMSTWYIRRSRDRFKSDDKIISNTASRHTALVLLELSKIIAPFMPFIAEDIYERVRTPSENESVHLTEWPKEGKVDEDVLLNMEEVRRIVSLAMEKRNTAGIKVRQPLANLKIKNLKIKNLSEYLPLIIDEVNVKEIEFNSEIKDEVELDTEITEELKREGNVRELVRAIQELRKEKGLSPKDKAVLVVDTNNSGKEFVKSVIDEIKKPTNLEEITFDQNNGKEISVSENKFKIELK